MKIIQTCDVCHKPIQKSKMGNTVYDIDNYGNLLCEKCIEKARHIAELEKTFDEPLHRREK